MKYFLSLFILISIHAQAQNYNDSTITVTMPRCFAWWITKSIAQSINKDNYRMLTTLQQAVSDTTKPDSLFTITLKSKYIIAGIELLITRPAALSITDRLKIINNQRVGSATAAIPGYTAMETQIVQKSNGATSEKNVATHVKNWYVGRNADFTTLYKEEAFDITELVKPGN